MPPPDDAPGHPDYRFTLANERTLLAWLRTGLALAAGGVAVATYAPDLGVRWGSAAVALALVLIGLGTALAGYRRWRADEGGHAARGAPPAERVVAPIAPAGGAPPPGGIAPGGPLPANWLMPMIAAAVAAVVVVVAVLVGVEVLRG